ncbi:hypothetical protein [Streptomyces sp. cmx-4-9]|uniref:hypothetical protein n=1 Tax=Streptomyces sp. cmx-4-9 TaxID=2790941 RepID=UPI00397FD590
MSFDEEWLAARATAAAHVSMRLNQVTVEPGSGDSGDLDLNQDHIGAIGTAAHTLHSRLLADGKHAATTTSEAAGALTKEGFATGAALLKAHTVWESQVKTLVAACANVSNGLNYSLRSHAKDEHHLQVDFASAAIDQYLQ